jgi:hypothetical protein
VPAHPVARAEEAGAEHIVGAPARDRIEHALEIRGVVLAVAVEVDGGGVALVAGDLEPGAQGGAEAARYGMGVHPRTLLPSDLRRGIARTVVDEQHVHRQAARLGGDAPNDSTDGSLLIPRDDDGKRPA